MREYIDTVAAGDRQGWKTTPLDGALEKVQHDSTP